MSGTDDGVPWAVDAEHVAGKRLEVALGSYVGAGREPDDEFSMVDDDAPLADAPDVWSDGSLVLDGSSGVCRLYCSVLGPFQTVQRAEIW